MATRTLRVSLTLLAAISVAGDWGRHRAGRSNQGGREMMMDHRGALPNASALAGADSAKTNGCRPPDRKEERVTPVKNVLEVSFQGDGRVCVCGGGGVS